MAKIKINFIALFLLIFVSFSFAQKTNQIDINVDFKFNSESLVLNKKYISKNDTLLVSTCKLYLTHFRFTYKDQSVNSERNSYHLIDIENPESMKIAFKNLSN